MEARWTSAGRSAAVGCGSLDGFETVTLAAGDLVAAFAPAAGMVGVSLRHQGEELLALRNGLGAYAATGDTMGIPFLHPWANRLSCERYVAGGREVLLPAALPRDGNGLAIHGVLPSKWRVLRAEADELGATLRATLQFACCPAFPFPHAVEQRVTLEPAGLRIETMLAATGHVAVPVSFGFHPYFTLPGANREDWLVALPRRRHLLTDERKIPNGKTVQKSGLIRTLGRRVYDDGYDALGPEPEFRVAGGGRSLSVCFLAGYPIAQFFAPRGQDVVCFEPMTAPTNALVTGRRLRWINPGRRCYAAFEVCVRPSL